MIVRAQLFLVAVSFMSVSSTQADGGVTSKLRMSNFCIGSSCLQSSHVSKKSVQTEFGAGRMFVRPGDEPSEQSVCYTSADGSVSAEFTFSDPTKPLGRYPLSGLTISNQKICVGNSSVPKKALPQQIGSVRLGMTEEKMIAALGKPVRIDDAAAREKRNPRYAGTRYSVMFGEKVYVYNGDDELGFVFVFLRAGAVSTIWAAISG